MYRHLICLSLCLFLAPQNPEAPSSEVHLAPVACEAAQEPLPTKDPLTFLEKCLERYDEQGIKGYSALLHKQERIGGKLQPSELIEVVFRDKPHSVFFHWLRGQRKATAALYVEGENDNKMLAHPAGVAGALVKYVSRDVDGADAKQSGRYTLNNFGLKKATEKSLKDWKAARDKGTLKVEYLGVRKVKEAGDKLCYTLRRTCKEPEEDGFTEVTLYLDKDTWLQVGTVLKDPDNKLIGEYMFRDLRLNPKFKPDQFKAAALTP